MLRILGTALVTMVSALITAEPAHAISVVLDDDSLTVVRPLSAGSQSFSDSDFQPHWRAVLADREPHGRARHLRLLRPRATLASIEYFECSIGGGFCNETGLVNYPLAVLAAAVPEPATFALIMLGLAGVGAAARRRRLR